MRAADLQALRIKIASPEDILSWSHGDVRKPETINYRTQRPEKDGLFCEKIFGPTKDFECYCSKYKGIRFKGIICDRCGVEITKSSVRRERMGHIKLATPVSHIWFLRGVPSRIGMVLGLPSQKLEKVIYFAAYIITKVDESARSLLLKELDQEFKNKSQNLKKPAEKPTGKKTKIADSEQNNLKDTYLVRKQEILSLEKLAILSEAQYREYLSRYGEIFEAGTGAEAVREIFEKIDLKKEVIALREKLEKEIGIQRKKTLSALRLFEGMQKAGLRPEWMIIKVLPVLPPDLRPMVQLDGGRYASSDLNDLYRRVINRNNRLKYLLEIAAPDVIVRNEKRMLQEAVDALLDNKMRKSQMVTATTGGKRVLKSLADILAGKQGRFRKNLLGKRVDYSARSVIAPGPEFQLFQCGIPKTMALELFRPFVIKRLLEKELAFNIRGAAHLIEEGTDEVWASLEEAVEGKLILLNRAPTLHRLGIQAFEPKLIEGEAIKLHPMSCTAFNADFDGDQMAVHLPLSEDAQQEARNLMLSARNILRPADGLPIVTPAKDMILGCYYLTGLDEGALGEGISFPSVDETILAYQMGVIGLRSKIKVLMAPKEAQIQDKKSKLGKANKSEKLELIETTCGRLIFNQTLPETFAFFNEQATSKKISKMLSRIVEDYTLEETQQTLDKIKDVGFEFATLSGVSWGMDDLSVPKEKATLIAEAEKEVEKIEEHYKKGYLTRAERSSKLVEIWQKVKLQIEKLIPETLVKDGSVYSMINSGARGSWAQPIQMAGMKGLVTSPSGRIIELPVKSSFKEGFSILEYFISTHGARKGTSDTALRTSASGYLTRRLVDVVHEMIISDKDCGCSEGLEALRKEASDIGQDFRFKIVGRVAMENIENTVTKKIIATKGELISWQAANEIDELKIEKVKVRSPLTCKNRRRVCQLCYGWDMGRNALVNLGEAVGIVAAQSIGEPGTQLTMRTFHTGGVSGAGDITRGLPRVEEIFESRIPKGEGTLSLTKGRVEEVDLEKGIIKLRVIDKKVATGVKKKSKDGEIVEYRVPLETDVYVKKGDLVEPGQAFCQGSLDLKKLFKTTGLLNTQRYIVREVQKIYTSEGINIHDKHIEIVVRQMFSRLRIVDPGDGPWVTGQIVSLVEFEEIQKELIKTKKKPGKGKRTILGISRVALTSDSFLSAASFQETSRVLIKAALEGRDDHLLGLKENVILGRLIPAGTGFRK
ncbi:MAG: DNA-directed RNA polymerase subunit beta' [Candidatus Gribaldobacteria bacterium]|nr:DNA-directed RNA polymerase subunit beta' [Candidatus Gribaldobacteria bacterium]